MRCGRFFLLMMALAATVLAGCSSTGGPLQTYAGAARPPSDVVLVDVPEEIEVMAIDGHEPPPSFLKSRVQLALLPGEHVFSLRYVELFQLNADEHDVVRSKQAALRFTAVAGSHFRLQIPKQASVAAAREFAKAPQFSLSSLDGKAVAESTAVRSYAEASLVDTISQAFESATQGETAKPAGNLELLQDVWTRSSVDEKNAFRRWLETQAQP